MGNVFKSIALAAALTAGGTSVKAEGWLDTRVLKTKDALATLFEWLDPDKYRAARGVIEADLKLLDDGRLDPSDETTIRDHTGKLAPLFPRETAEVMEALNLADTVVAEKENAPLTEDPVVKRERLKREAEEERLERLKPDLIREFNERALDEDSWLEVRDGNNNWEINVKRSKKTLLFTLTDWDTGRVDTPEFKVIDGWYEMEINLSSETAKLILWAKNPDWSNSRMELWSGVHKVYLTSAAKAWLPLDKVRKTISLNWLSIKGIEIDKMAQQEK